MAERDHLVKKVFPNFRKHCHRRGVEFTEIDLRWGVTQAQAEQGKIISICLREIDHCRPYFIGIIGDRYGWVPGPEDLAACKENTVKFPWIEDDIENGLSITEIEIQYGVLRETKKPAGAFFYFKAKKERLVEEDDPQHIDRLDKLKRRISDSPFPSKDFMDIHHLEQLVTNDFMAFLDQKFPEEEKVTSVEQTHLDQAFFGRQQLKAFVGGTAYHDLLDEHINRHQPPLILVGQSGLGKSAILANWIAKFQRSHPDVLVVYYFIGATPDSSDPFSLVRFILEQIKVKFRLSAPIPENPEKMIQSLLHCFLKAHRFEKWVLVLDGIDQLDEEGRSGHLSWLPDRFPENMRVILSTRPGSTFETLKKKFYPDLALKPFYAETGEQQKQRHCKELLYSRKGGRYPVKIRPLEIMERKAFIKLYLGVFGKTLEEDLIQQIAMDSRAEKPLFLKSILDELRIFGVHEALQKRIHYYLSTQDMTDFFKAVLDRIERDFQGNPSEMVRNIFSFIQVSRQGLYETEILEIVGIPVFYWTQLATAVEDYLLRINGRLNFAHESFCVAVENKYLSDNLFKEQCHLKLVEYFSRDALSERSLNELPYHLIKLKAWEKLQDYLADLNVFVRFSTDQKRYRLLDYWNEMPPDYNKPGEIYSSALARFEREEASEIKLAHACNQVGEFLFIAGELKASESIFVKSLEIREKIWGPVHPDIADSLNNMAVVLDQRGAFDHAAELFRKSLEMNEKIYGSDHAGNVVILNNLAVALINANGNLEKAEKYFQRALEINEKQYGKRHDQTSFSLAGLAKIHEHKGEYEKAESLFKEALEIRKNIFGKDHPKTMSTLTDLAWLYYEMGDYINAEPLLEDILKILGKRLAEKHPDTISNMISLSSLCLDKLEFEKAEKLILKSLTLSETVFGIDHYKTSVVMTQQARLMLHKGDYHQAESLLRKVLDTTQQAYETKSLAVVTSRLRLAQLLIQTGKPGEARTLLKQVYETQKCFSKPLSITDQPPENRIDQRHFSDLLVAAGYFNLAEPILEKLYLESKNSRGPEDFHTQLLRIDLDIAHQEKMAARPDLPTEFPNKSELKQIALKKITFLNRQANKFAELKQIKIAIPYCQRSLDMATIGFGPHHPETGAAVEKLAGLHSDLRNFQWALYFYRLLVHIYSICLGTDHLKTAEAINNVALGYYQIGDFEKARTHFKYRLKILEKRLGPDHPETIKARDHLIGFQTAMSFV